jgi:hypothetical protein
MVSMVSRSAGMSSEGAAGCLPGTRRGGGGVPAGAGGRSGASAAFHYPGAAQPAADPGDDGAGDSRQDEYPAGHLEVRNATGR